MLFQKLKESGQRPVFMLRHIVRSPALFRDRVDWSQRDIKSPIAVAQQKQATKLGLPPNTTTKVLPKISSSDASPTKVNGKNLQPGRSGDEGQTPNGGTFPELPSPGLRDGDGLRSAGATGTVVDEEGNVTNITYAVAIYPLVSLSAEGGSQAYPSQVHRGSAGRI